MNEVIIIAWPSWSWKDTLISNLLETWLYQKLVSDTTRQERVWEVEWKDYYFQSQEQFQENFDNNLYFQYSKFCWTSYAYKKAELLEKIKISSVLVISHPQAIMLITFFLEQNKIPYKTVYLDIPRKKTFERMELRGDTQENIKKRKDEYAEFVWYKKKADIVLDSSKSQTDVISEYFSKLSFLIFKKWTKVIKKKDYSEFIVLDYNKKKLELISMNWELKKEVDDWEDTSFSQYLLTKYEVSKWTLEEALENMKEKILKNSVSIPKEVQKALNRDFWKLI